MNGLVHTGTMNIADMRASRVIAPRGARGSSSVFFCLLKVIDPPQGAPSGAAALIANN